MLSRAMTSDQSVWNDRHPQPEVGHEFEIRLLEWLTSDGKKVKAGTPTVKGAKVTAEVVEHARGPKIQVFKFKRRKNYRKKTGHRQDYTEIVIKDVKSGT